ncbi:Hsp70 family protein [Dactylosporangium matsuzakiense]|uniref:Hsp70 protein n=1 Tax=Dactylosporangium matsuzakiense TaxID=53360 RepID=A0A9W6KGI4_9ACTN|nr:Hsp70 family protein [Dactylosporangium matsuzakiense]UWZ42198.1 Hsp70 family protein [Dactylosporangium matsuzakiense]GLK99840.1 hypothetical protein GCM10017581_015810 [Dactylosporangium matsuzakiense]
MTPTQPPEPVVIGVDLGTSSTVAVIGAPGRPPRTLLFDGSPLLPSGVAATAAGRLLTGRDALQTATVDPAAFEPYPKQRIDDGSVLLGGVEVPVPRLFEAILDRVLTEARGTGRLDDQPAQLIIACPAAWSATRRQTLLAAAPPATRLVDEPIAAAHAFADHLADDGALAVVYDLGAGTFDAALVRRTADAFTVVADRGIPDCGGLDIDAAIVAHLHETGDPATWSRLDHPQSTAEHHARRQLWDNVRAAKEMLSRSSTAIVYVPLLELEVPLGREQLDRLASPVIDRTVSVVRDLLATADLSPSDLSAILLSGGASRMPAITTALHRAFGRPPATVDQPELAVAEGTIRAATEPVLAAPSVLAEPSVISPAPVSELLPARSGGRYRRTAFAAAAALTAAAITTAVLWKANAGDGTEPPRTAALTQSAPASPSPSPSPSPSYPEGVDPCLLGTWRFTTNDAYGLIGGVQVLYTGGAGVLVTYRPDRTTVIDYTNMEPRTAKYGNDTWSDVHRGTTSGTYYAANGTVTMTITHSDAVDTVRRNGKVNATGPVTYFPEPEQYRCIGDELTSYSTRGSFSIRATRQPATPN